MDHVEIDVAEIEIPEAALERSFHTLQICGPELSCYKYFFTGNATRSNGPADTLLIAIELGCIDEAITHLKRPPHGIFGLLALAHLPDAKPECWHGDPVVERYRASDIHICGGAPSGH